MSDKSIKKILVINTCSNELHYLEFINPIIRILKEHNNNNSKNNLVTVKHFSHINKEFNFSNFDKIIISGTSLKDFNYLDKDFSFIKECEKPILGICAGMQIVCKSFGCDLIRNSENNTNNKINNTHIGLKTIELQDFLGISKTIEVYCLHKNNILRNKIFEKNFVDCSNGSMHAIKHKNKNIFGVLFHPEVRNHELIINFVNS